jgi:hypothetical protein
LIPYIRDNHEPTQLPAYFGNAVIDPASFTGELCTEKSTQNESTKDFSWSRGLGVDFSPIKMRSSRKKMQSASISTLTTDPSTSDSGALRAVKALAWAK